MPTVIGSLLSPDDLQPKVRASLVRQILTLADSKRLLGLRYSDWILGSPSIETGIATSSMAQDEWGHARLLYAMLRDLGPDPTWVEQQRPADQWASVDVLDTPCADWGRVIMMIHVVDGALQVALEGFSEGLYDAARARVPKMLAEETFHHDLGLAWLRRIAGGSREGAEHLATAAREFLPRTLAWLTPEDATYRCLEEAKVVPSSRWLLERISERIGPALEGIGVRLDSVAPERDGWDEQRSRGPGHPDHEAVERARGDRNRALFVE